MRLLCSLPGPRGALFKLPTRWISPRYQNRITHDGDPGVPPVVAALARYGQHGVGDPWAEVTGRVDGVAGRTTQREPDAEDEQTNEKRVQAGSYDRRRITSDRPGVRDNPRNA